MKKMIVQLFALGLLIGLGQGLKCYHCPIGILSLCFTTETICPDDEVCFKGSGSAAGIDVIMRGCVQRTSCNSSTSVGLGSVTYNMQRTCCETNLCNAAPGLVGASGLGLALATITALLITRALV